MGEAAREPRRTWRQFVEEQVDKKAKIGERFTIQDIYEMEQEMKERYPNNRHILETIRDNMQILRDEEKVEQLGARGTAEAGEWKRLS